MTEQEKQPRYFYVGQTVYQSTFGRGEVLSIGKDFDYPVTVKFPDGSIRGYTYDGRTHKDHLITLSQTPIPEIQNVPLPEMPDLKEGDAVWYWDNKKEYGGIGIFVKYVYGDEYPFKISDYRNDSGLIGFKYAEKYDREKHYKNETSN